MLFFTSYLLAITPSEVGRDFNLAEDDINLKRNITSVRVAWPFFFSSKVKALIQACFEFDPVKRIKIDEIFEHPWMVKYKDLL